MATLGDHSARDTPARLTAALGAVWPLAAAVAFALLVHFSAGSLVGPYPRRVMLDAGVAVILAVSLNIVNGYTGQFSIGHAAFMACGAYAAGAITYYGSLLIWGQPVGRGNPIFGTGELMMAGACLVGGLVAAGAGWLVGLPSLRLRGDYLAIVTLGFGEILRVLLQQTNNQIYSAAALRRATTGQLIPPPLGGAQGFTGIPTVTNLFWVWLSVAVTVLFAYRLKQSSYGRALLSIREDEIAAEAMGVNITKLKVRAFVLAAFFAGVAGGLYAHQSGTVVRPIDAGFLRSFEIVIMVVLGGLGSISGAVLAAILLTVMQALLIDLAQYRMVLYALALILLMIFRPQGLFGIREIWDWFPGRRRGREPRGFEVQPQPPSPAPQPKPGRPQEERRGEPTVR